MAPPSIRAETVYTPKPNRYLELAQIAMSTRTMLEHAWSPETAYQNITLQPTDTKSRGQCGVSSLWLSRHLVDQGFDAIFTEGKIHIPNDKGDDHVWVEVRGVADEPVVVDITSDQYQTVWGSAFHIGPYEDGNGVIGHYTPEWYFDPDEVPRKKLLARYAILENNIAKLPRRYRQLIRTTEP